MYNPILSNEFFVILSNPMLDNSIINALSFLIFNVKLDIINNIFECKITQTYELNTRKIIYLLKDVSFDIELYEGSVYPDYIRKILLKNCYIIDHQQRFNYSDTTVCYNFIQVKFQDIEDVDSANDEIN